MTNKDIMTKGQQYVMNTYGRFPITPVKGRGSYLWDANGKEYLDFISGIAVCGLGHCHPELAAVLKEQADTLWHVSNLYWIKSQVEAAEKLAKITGMGKSFFCNSGAEANEAALKLARKYFYRRQEGWKNQVVVFKDSFHGRTLATVTATGQAKYQEGFAPLPEGFAYAEFNNLDSVKEVINENTCAIMLEAVQGEGGINPVHPEFVQGLRQLCDEKHMLLIFDEVQCGMGRSGKFFAFENYGVKADIVTIAKSLAGGVPIGVMMATDEASSGFAPGDHGSTFGGNPLATAVACKVLDIIGDPAFLQQVQEKGQYLKDSLNSLGDDRITEVRGIGLILGMEFNTEVKELINLCMDKGLLLLSAGPKTIRFVPPLTINTTEINQGVAIIREALKEW